MIVKCDLESHGRGHVFRIDRSVGMQAHDLTELIE